MEEMAGNHSFPLPPFCGWTPAQWLDKGHEYDEIRETMLGWDVTDYSIDKFNEFGFTLVTIRNGKYGSKIYEKTYAEKLLMLEEKQYSPMHFHREKMEDIINRGGGNVLIRVYNSTPAGTLADSDVEIYSDGRKYSMPAGLQIRLTPGESITIYQGLCHDFAVEPGTGAVLLGEVSMCNDDNNDNYFFENFSRFPEIEEDEPSYRLLCTEYPPAARITPGHVIHRENNR